MKWTLSVFLIIFFLEVVSGVINVIRGSFSFSYPLAIVQKDAIIKNKFGEKFYSTYGNALENNKSLHPYFAYHFDPEHKRSDFHGFEGEVKFPLVQKGQFFIVGILGGSVAQGCFCRRQ